MSLAESLQRAADIQELRRAWMDGLIELSRLTHSSDLLELADHLISEEALARCQGRMHKAHHLIGCTKRQMWYRVHKHKLPYVTAGQARWGHGL